MTKNVPHEPTNGPVAWVGLIVGSLALLISGAIYIDLYNLKMQLEGVTETTMDVSQDAVVVSRQAIIDSASAIDNAISEEDFARELALLRLEIAQASQNASQETRQQLAIFDSELENIEVQVRTNTVEAIEAFQQFAQRLQQDIEKDQEGVPLN